VENAQFNEAKAVFVSLGSYKDSADRVRGTEYARAVYTAEQGDPLAAARLFRALGSYRDAAAQAEAMYDRYYGAIMNPLNLAYNEGRYEEAIGMIDTLDMTDVPEKYAYMKSLYKESCYLLGNRLFDAGKPYEALQWYQRIPGYKSVDSKLQKGCYLILGSWTDLQGNVYEFYDDGVCRLNGELLSFTIDGDRMYTGETADLLAETHRLTGVNRQHAWLYDLRSGTEITIYLTRAD